MDRVVVYPYEGVQDVDILLSNKNAMVALAYLTQALLGTSTYVDGLACTQTTIAGMTVNVAGGSIYSLEEIDATDYGSVVADTVNQIMKQGIVIGTTNFACPAPVTAGQSVVYLIQAQFSETDGGSTNEPFINSMTGVPYSSTVNTVRQGVCVLTKKTGTAATTGTQVAPTPDAGFTPLWAITVANGQTAITSTSIAAASGSPFIPVKLPAVIAAVQTGSFSYALDSSGTPNTITAAFNPSFSSIATGQPIRIKVANTNTGPVVINPNGLGNIGATMTDGSAIPPGTLKANGVYTFVSDGSFLQLQAPPSRRLLTANTSFFISTAGSDSNFGLSGGAAWLTKQHAWDWIQQNLDLGSFTAAINIGNGTYTDALLANGPVVGATSPGSVQFVGNTGSPSSVLMNVTGNTCFTGNAGALFSVNGLEVQGGGGLNAEYASVINASNIVFFTCTSAHIQAIFGGFVNMVGSYSISGGAAEHWNATNGGQINVTGGSTISLVGPPGFSNAFGVGTLGGVISVPSVTFSGSATGPRYNAVANGIINTNGGGSTYLPGNSAGSVSNGGLYL